MANINQIKKDYQQIVDKHSPKNKVVTNSIKAFFVGGLICTLGQLLINLYMYFGLSFYESTTLATDSLIFISFVVTAFNVYDNIGKVGGAGALVPITGFANSMVSAAMEYKKEGYIYGMGAKLFTIAGPVIVFGTIASVVIGIIYYFV
ncbi:MAG: stage V sporulation protein AC [Cellulosilyticum sp.]|nr:stage V sporulation protein AC [Cellulosilyticum sp.]MEE1072253.1 stage V sporulation protein AC [Cellulosilyticum sp.]